MFYFSDKELTDALCFLAQRRGIKVRVLTDNRMNTPAHRPTLEQLSQHGVSVHILPMTGSALMHLKCAVIDGETVIAGTANWTPTAFAQNFEDTVAIRSLELGAIYSAHIETLLRATDNFYSEFSGVRANDRICFPEISRFIPTKTADRFYASGAHTIRDIRQIEVFFTPGREGIQRLLAQARAATQRIDIGMYLVNDPEVVQTLLDIAREGKIQIRMLVDAGMLAGSLLACAQQLGETGIDIHYYQKDREALHLKTAIIDGRYVWTGTANWTTGALDLNVEDMLFFDSPEMARRYTAFLDGIQKTCKPFTPVTSALPEDPTEPDMGEWKNGYLTGLPLSGPRTNYNNLRSDPIFPSFDVQASFSYLPDEEYLPVLLNLIRNAHQSILIAMFVMSETKGQAEAQEQVIRALEQVAARGVYVYLLLQMPTSVQDRLHESHSAWAEKLRAKGIDVRLNLPQIHLHAKMVVVDLAKVLIGSHNWSEGALSGKRVYESSALLVLPEQDIRFAEYILGRQTISDMRSKEQWEQEIALLRRVVTMSAKERDAFFQATDESASTP